MRNVYGDCSRYLCEIYLDDGGLRRSIKYEISQSRQREDGNKKGAIKTFTLVGRFEDFFKRTL